MAKLITKLISFTIALFALKQLLVILPQFYNFISDFSIDPEKMPISDSGIIYSLVHNLVLIGGFIFQHTFMAKAYIKSVLQRIYLDQCERSLYLIISTIILELLFTRWIYIPSILLWNWKNESIHFIISIIHNFMWLYIFMASILFDFMDLVGMKQVYYFINDWGDPLIYKSPELQNFYKHMRHPSFYGFFLLFWLNPIMSLDRFIFALVMTFYMIYGWRVNEKDCLYIKSQWSRKEQTFAY